MKISVLSNSKLFNRLVLSQVKLTKIKKNIFQINGGYLALKNPPNALVFCMHVEEIRLYKVIKFHQIPFRGMAVISGQNNAK